MAGTLSDFVDAVYRGPKKAGEDAYGLALESGLGSNENSKSDAVKHIVWQAEITKALMEKYGLSRGAAAALANTSGVGKEVLMDWVGSLFSPETIGNTPMDLRNNAYGAKHLPLEGDIAANAIKAVRGTATPSMWDAITNKMPYASK